MIDKSLKQHNVGISEMYVTTDTNDLVATYSLGSCLGLTAFDTETKVGGLIHCLLPLSSIDEEKARKIPEMFVETGVPYFFNKLYSLGAKKKSIIVKAAGCGAPLNNSEKFNIGERNFIVLRKILWKNSMLLKGHDTGGKKARTMFLNMKTGITFIKSDGQFYEI